MTSRIAELLANKVAVPGHKPWPRYEVDADTWNAIGQGLGTSNDLLALWGEKDAVHLALRAPELASPCVISLRVKNGEFPSIGRHHPPALRLERALHDLYGFKPAAIPDQRPWLDHGAWSLRAPLGSRDPAPLRNPAAYDFLPVHGEGLHQIAVGPVHAGIIEPGHFRFTANGETVARLEQRLGYVHKGIDGLLTDVELSQAARVVARVSGDATVAYSFAFARAVEVALGVEAPARANILRGIMAELERIANHFGDIGAICNDAAFVLAHAHCGIFRERVLAAADRAFGHRLMMDCIVPGGVTLDIGPGGAHGIQLMIEEIEKPFAEIVRLYDDTPSLQDRTCTTGTVQRDLVDLWAAGGFVGRASGRNFDCRREVAYAPYVGASFDVPLFEAGDVDARIWVRIREVEQSFRLLKTWLADLPAGPIQSPLPANVSPCEGIAMTEAFRGDVLIWVRLDANGRVARCHARDPSWFQWPLLEAAIEGNIVADFPLCNKSFNCSYRGKIFNMRTLLLRSLFARPVTIEAPAPEQAALAEIGRELETRARRLFGRSITIREVDTGSCNGCELEIHALNNAVYDVERFGIKFAASPRHADVLLVTGPVSHNMKVALERTYAATPSPKWVVAVGDCACGCGVFADSYATVGAVEKVVPVDLHIKGCPPRPIDLLKGLIALMDKATAKAPAV